MIATTIAPVATIMPGGCLPPWITPTFPAEPKPWERNCWNPTKWNDTVQIPAPDADVQAADGAALIG